MEKAYANILEQALSKGLHESGLQETPKRAAEALRYLTQGYQQSLDDIKQNGVFPADTDQLVLVKDIELYSLCEHHILPFFGSCHVAYLPAGNIIGLSEIAKIVDLYARRLQLQEQLTEQIAKGILEVSQAAGVAVVINAQHLCMMMRGIQKQHASLTTSVLLGAFREQPDRRSEFFGLLRG